MKAHDVSIRAVDPNEAVAASAMVQESFLKLASQGWAIEAQQRFLAESDSEALGGKISTAACAIGAFFGEQIVGFLLMPIPTRLGMLFVHPGRLREGIATKLWESARARLESEFPEVMTVELNATPYAVEFYRAAGFVPISAQYGTHTLRRTKASLIYRRTKNLRAVQLHLPGLFGNLELHRSLSLLLHDDRPSGHAITVRDVWNEQLHQVAGPELTVYGEIKHGELADALPELKANTDRPDVLKPQRRLLADQLALVPGLASADENDRFCIHDTSPV